MAEELQCLIQYVRDNFGEEYIHKYVNIADDGDDTYCLDFNTFTESSTFDHSSATPDASNPDSTTRFVSDLFSSPSPCTQGPAPAMESTGPHGCSYSPDGGPGLELSGSFPDNLQPFDQPLAKSENEYPTLAAYIGLPQANIQNVDFNLHGRQSPSHCQGFEGNNITLDEMLQEQSAANSCMVTSTSGISSSEGERRTSFWRGKSPALLMQQLKGPSLSASSSSSEARTKSSSNQPTLQKLSSSSAPNPTLGPRSPLNLTTVSNRDYRSVGDIKGANLPMQPVSMLSKSAPGFSGQRFLPPLGSDININSNKFKNIVSSGRVDQGQRILRSSSFDPQLIGNRGDAEMQVASISHLKQRRKIMPGLAILGEMQRSAACGYNSWSSSSTSPGPSSNIDHDREVAASVQKVNYSTMSVDREVRGGDRVWKKAKGEPGSTSEGGAVQTGNIAAAMVEQREKSQLQEKLVALLQTDSSTSKVLKVQILDDTIKYLKELRKRLNANGADSTHKSTQTASPATSSRGRKYGDGLAIPIRLEDLKLETAGVEIGPHLNVDSGPQIEVRMMENQHVMVKLTAEDRPGLFNDIMAVLRSLRLDIQHANIRTGNNGRRHDIFAAKMQLPIFSSQSTHSIAMALNQVISDTAAPFASSLTHTVTI